MAESTQQTNGAPTRAPHQGAYRLPHSLEAERNLLGCMLLDPDCIAEVTEIARKDDFYLEAHRLIFAAITEIYDEHQVVDMTMLVDTLQRRHQLEEAGGVLTIGNLEQNVLSTGSAPDLARIVSEKSVLRRLMGVAEDILRDCAEERRDVDKQIDVAEKKLFDVGQQTSAASFVSIGDMMGSAIEEIGRLYANRQDVTGLRTHFIELDKILNGLHKSDLLVLAARPSVGKTAFALNIAMNVAVKGNAPVGIFSLEMSKEQLNRRLLCSYAQESGQEVSRGNISEATLAKLRQKATELEKAPIFIDDSPGLSIMQLRARARRLHSMQKIELLIIDYLQLMSGTDKGGRDQNRQQEVSEISRGLKALARELGIPVMALSQLSRNIEQRSGKEKSAEPMLSDLRESGAIEQDADIVMFVHRERPDTKEEENTPANKQLPIETKILVRKHRNGAIGPVSLLFYPSWTRFFDRAGPG